MLISKGGDYAIRAMLDLASRPPEERTVTQGIAGRQKIPPAFLSKVLAQLTQAGLVRTYRGATGGVGLARSPEEISLLAVVEAMEGPIILTECTDPYSSCPFQDSCPARPIWQEAKESLQRRLGGVSVAELVDGGVAK